MSYFVVAIERGDPLSQRHQFNEIGYQFVRESMERITEEIRSTGDSAFVNSVKQVETYTFGDVMPGYEHSLPEWAKSYLPTEEYKKIGKVYFLNELALQMYKEGGVEFECIRSLTMKTCPQAAPKPLVRRICRKKNSAFRSDPPKKRLQLTAR